MKQNKKAFSGLNFVFSAFGIAMLLVVFYVWMGDNITEKDEIRAEDAQLSLNLQTFFSRLVSENGAQLIEDEDKTEEIIEKFAGKDTLIPKAGQSAWCDEKDAKMECILTLSAVLGEKTGWSSTMTAYLPKDKKAMQLSLQVRVP